MGTWEIRQGHVLDLLGAMEDESVQCVVTSPPYWGLRDYGLEAQVWGGDPGCEHEWNEWRESHQEPELAIAGKSRTTDRSYDAASRRFNGSHQRHAAGAFCLRCPAWLGSLGLESTPELYVDHLVAVFAEIRRVLRKDGTAWLNLGDSSTARTAQDSGPDGMWVDRSKRAPVGGRWGGGAKTAPGLRPKNLVGIPWRVAFALQAAGWNLRAEIIWAKANPMPESVRDRPTRAHEQIFLLSRSQRYFYDADAIMEPVSSNTHARLSQDTAAQVGSARANGGSRSDRPMKAVGRAPGVNPKASENDVRSGIKQNASFSEATSLLVTLRNKRSVWTLATESFSDAHFATFPKALVEPCIKAGSRLGDTVLDPFAGSGTVGVVALYLERAFIGIELSPVYAEMAERRTTRPGCSASRLKCSLRPHTCSTVPP